MFLYMNSVILLYFEILKRKIEFFLCTFIKKKMRRYKCPRFSQERLNEAVDEEITKKGVKNITQAMFFNQLCKEIIKSKNEKLYPIRPHVQIKKSDPFEIATHIALEYLKSMQMEMTIETLNLEAKEKTKPIFFTHGKLGIRIDQNTIPNLIKSTDEIRNLNIKEKIQRNNQIITGPKKKKTPYEDVSESD